MEISIRYKMDFSACVVQEEDRGSCNTKGTSDTMGYILMIKVDHNIGNNGYDNTTTTTTVKAVVIMTAITVIQEDGTGRGKFYLVLCYPHKLSLTVL